MGEDGGYFDLSFDKDVPLFEKLVPIIPQIFKNRRAVILPTSWNMLELTSIGS